MEPQLTNIRHIALLDEYFKNGFNLKRAYMKIYPDAGEATAESASYEVMTRPEVKAELERRKQEVILRGQISRDEIVVVLKNLVQDCLNDNDRHHLLKAINELNKMAGFHSSNVNVTSSDANIQIIRSNIVTTTPQNIVEVKATDSNE